MSTNLDNPNKRYRSLTALAERYGCSKRTIDRWRKRGVIPPPDATVMGHDLWLDRTLDAADKANTAKAATG